MSDLNEKKSLLGSNMFNFISNLASKALKSPQSTDESIKSPESGMDVEEEPKEPKIADLDQSLSVDFNLELKSDSDTKLIDDSVKIAESIVEPEFKFELLSKSENEYFNSQLKDKNILKGCKWSPDGTCIITNSEDTCLRIFDLNADMLNEEKEKVNELHPSLKMTEPEIIYDYAWYPFMTSTDPLTACVFSSCKDNPIHLYDAYTGRIRCSYKGYNHLDELVSAYSIAFDPTGTKIYAGYNKCIKIFDISVPGKNFQDVKLQNESYKMPGIISCLAFPKQQTGFYAAGSYTKYIGIFVESTNEPVCLIQSHQGGLTHLQFSLDGNKLFSGARKDSDIYCWDLRQPGKMLQVFKRDCRTNQRIYFDLYQDCKYLSSGNTDGTIKFWKGDEFDLSKEDEPILASFKAHNDCVNGINFHPSLKLLATSSGQRRLIQTFSDSSSNDEEQQEEEIKTPIVENSLKIWKHYL